MVLKCENRFQNHSKIILDFSTVYIAQSKLLKSRNLEKRFRKLIWFFLVVWFKKIILGGNTKSELCSIMLQSHIILELLFANSFSNWVESRKNSSTAFGKCVQNPTFTFISILLQRRFFCLLKKTKRDAWLVLNYFCISIISVLFKRKKQKKISKEPFKKIHQWKKVKHFCLFWPTCSHALISQVIIFEWNNHHFSLTANEFTQNNNSIILNKKELPFQ